SRRCSCRILLPTRPPHLHTGMLIFCPTWRLNRSTPGLAASSALTSSPNSPAMVTNASPALISLVAGPPWTHVLVPPSFGFGRHDSLSMPEQSLEGILRFCPAMMTSGFVMLFALAMLQMPLSNDLASLPSVSPVTILWSTTGPSLHGAVVL